ncbi:MAG: SH3 domain-containing protein [Lachnospiraceae bacterium]|nr:SH3 domain-containing protein [Lachnospiraceae bacterium]
MNVRDFFADRKKRRTVVTISLMVVFFTCTLILVWTCSEKLFQPVGFGKVSPSSVESMWRSRLSRHLPGIYRTQNIDENGKFSYERFSKGDTMYCRYFGLLNIRSEPNTEAAVVAHISYGDSIQVFWKENTGYVRVCYQKPHSAQIVEGYCMMEELSQQAPSDGRVFLDIPRFKQQDPRWGSLPLGDSYETIESAGCATSCLAMSYSYLEGMVTTPDAMAERLFYDEEGNLGFPRSYEKNWDTNYLELSLLKLRDGIPVLIGGFTEDRRPHWVLITGYTGDGTALKASDFLIHDPASDERPTLAEFFTDYPIYNKIVYYTGEES